MKCLSIDLIGSETFPARVPILPEALTPEFTTPEQAACRIR
jgi:hypothetical protein